MCKLFLIVNYSQRSERVTASLLLKFHPLKCCTPLWKRSCKQTVVFDRVESFLQNSSLNQPQCEFTFQWPDKINKNAIQRRKEWLHNFPLLDLIHTLWYSFRTPWQSQYQIHRSIEKNAEGWIPVHYWIMLNCWGL